jgi:DNA-binding SARP family transcriptional activator
VELQVLGPLAVVREGQVVDHGGPKQSALLAALVLHLGQVVRTDALVDLVWGDRPPPSVTGTLQAYVAGLRRVLEPDRAPRSAPAVLVTQGAGYALRLPDEALDAVRAERAVSRAGALLAPLVQDPTAPAGEVPVAEARALLAEATALWRGVPYAELGDAPGVVAERARLEDLAATAAELQALVRLAEGDAAGAAGDLERLTALHPLRERLWSLRVLALTRAGRQAEALGALREVRRLLADELGLDPGAELRRLEAAVLRQDPALLPAPVSRPPVAAPWPLVGREQALEQLVALLGRADGGSPQAAVLVGEPGIGKSRLSAELARVARQRGADVRIGRCSQDDGAPPLWPWTTVLDGLPGGPDLHADAGEPSDGFSTWEAVRRAVVDAARTRTLVVVLDDLHWSDASSLRVLRHLLDTTSAARLLVVATWRSHPAPTGRLAEAAESLARAHALRLELPGLSAGDTAALVEAVAGERPSDADARALSRRTDGNPFFLVEYARLLAASDDPRAALAAEPPPAVADVLRRRLAAVDDPTTSVLRAAAVLGRAFALDVLAHVSGRADVDVLDALDPALAAGLVVEDGVDRFRFAHALVRDAVLSAVPLSRRARLHARAGEVLDVPATRTEAARHWLAAGPACAARAWRTAAAAARSAQAVHAHEEARDLLHAALAAQEQDPAAAWSDRYDLLLALVDSCRLLADWAELTAHADRAVEVAETAGDAERAAYAAVQPAFGALWQPQTSGASHARTIAALRRALERLPAGDGDLRCRALCALAVELYYVSAPPEREALTEQALAMARRLGDADLLQLALQATFTATWRPASAERRLELATEGVALAERSGDERARATHLTLRTAVLGELGRVAEMRASMAQARALAADQRMAYLSILLGTMHAPWLAMAGRDAEAEQVLRELADVGRYATVPHAGDAIEAARLLVRTLQADWPGVFASMQAMAETSELPLTAPTCQLMLRIGLREQAAELLDAAGIDLTPDDWFSLLTWTASCEVAAELARPELAAAAYAKAAPYAGRVAAAGSSGALGPADGFLALAAFAAGDLEAARRHADDAERLCEQWAVPRIALWLRDQRDRHGF